MATIMTTLIHPARVLGVFTGQGAQWASMGRDLIRGSDFVRGRIESFQAVLADLPPGECPSWSLEKELFADSSTTRLHEAAISQPLCTAIQIVLVDLLRSTGITFNAVAGHSSGEIAAAYAAGFISAQDAIRIAYCRGFQSKHTSGTGLNGLKGAMLAVSTSVEDANEIC